MDIAQQYKPLCDKMEKALPLKASPIRELIGIFRDKDHHITLKSELVITGVHNSGDISGIMCMCKVENDRQEAIACALTHLIFTKKCPLYPEIIKYQKKREKRIRKLNGLR